MKELHTNCDEIMSDIDAINEIGKDMFAGQDIPAIMYNRNIRTFMGYCCRRKMSSESKYTNTQTLTHYLDAANENLQNIVLEPLPVIPQKHVGTIEGVMKIVTERASDVQPSLKSGFGG